VSGAAESQAVAGTGGGERCAHGEPAAGRCLVTAVGAAGDEVRTEARVLVPGGVSGAGPEADPDERVTVEGRPLRIAPVSFWGGVDAAGRIADVHHPHHGTLVTGRVLVLEASKGSSSGSSVLAELIVTGRAPAAFVLAEPDAIIAAGCLAAAELTDAASVPPVVQVEAGRLDAVGAAARVGIRQGLLSPRGGEFR
jgi:predicted aconitase with swiveling domain